MAGHIDCLDMLVRCMNIQTAVALALMRGVRRNLLLAAMRDLAPVGGSDAWLALVWERLEVETQSNAAAFQASFEQALAQVPEVLVATRDIGAALLPFGAEDYPALLAVIHDPPAVLWLRGDPDALNGPAMAIVGARAASYYAREAAERLAFDLARAGLVIVSGMARGVDGAAHEGTLAAGGRTVAVLGCGVDIAYPAEHSGLMGRIASSGAVISEFPPGTPPQPHHFPMRNRIISGLCRGVLVIEAGEKSGSLITARCALEQGREVMAMPGNALSGLNKGAHGLLKDGAKLVEGADDILEELRPQATSRAGLAVCKLLAHNGLILDLRAGETYGLEDLLAMTGLSAPDLLPRLLELELEGHLVRLPGGRFAAAGKRV